MRYGTIHMQNMWADTFQLELMMDWRCNRMIHYHYYVSISLTGKSIKSEAVKWSQSHREKTQKKRECACARAVSFQIFVNFIATNAKLYQHWTFDEKLNYCNNNKETINK